MATVSATLELEVLSPKKTVVKTTAESVVVPGLTGYREILPGHTAMICELGVGVLSFKSSDTASKASQGSFFVAGGFLQVEKNKLTLLADVIERPADVDRERALKARARAQGRLTLKSKEDIVDIERALVALRKADERLAFFEAMIGTQQK